MSRACDRCGTNLYNNTDKEYKGLCPKCGDYMRDGRRNSERLRQFCNAISEWRCNDDVKYINKQNLFFELGHLAFLCIEKEMTSDEAMKLWNENGCFVDFN